MYDNLGKKWENHYSKDTTSKHRIDLTNEDQEKMLENLINLVKALENELALDESYSPQLLISGLAEITQNLKGIKNGYMIV